MSHLCFDLQQPNCPTASDVLEVYHCLLGGSLSRESVSEWASKWFLNDSIEISDKRVLTGLSHLMAADAITDDGMYLFGDADFQDWLADAFPTMEENSSAT